MGGRPSNGLQPKHWKALQLIEEGNLSLKEIAGACGFSVGTMYDLYNGDLKAGQELGELFKSELNKITLRNTEKVRHLVKDNKKLALFKMNEYLRKLQKKSPTKPMMLEITRVLNSLSKVTPNVEIGSFSIHKGFTAEELIHEFKRLGALARYALDGRRIPGVGPGGTGELPKASGAGD